MKENKFSNKQIQKDLPIQPRECSTKNKCYFYYCNIIMSRITTVYYFIAVVIASSQQLLE